MDTTPIEVPLPKLGTAPATPYCPADLRRAFERTGWSSIEPLDVLPEGVTYGVVATRPDDGRGGVKALLFGYEGALEVQLADLWLVLAELDAVHPEVAALCLGHGATISAEAAETAALLELPVFRIVA
jgi:hypothetical protein